MIRTLVLKELRESLPIVAAAGLAAAYILAQRCGVRVFAFFGGSSVSMPFLDDIWKNVAVLGGFLAAALALKQTLWEESKGTFRYLLFRPIARKQLFLSKIVVGLSLVAVAMGAFILIYGVWATLPGRHASPFYWSMTVPSWHAWFVLPAIYSAAFVSGLRPGRWFGSKLLPLAGCIIVVFILLAQPWPWIALLVSALLTVLYVGTAIDVAESRDY
jgi:hypothetical protein